MDISSLTAFIVALATGIPAVLAAVAALWKSLRTSHVATAALVSAVGTKATMEAHIYAAQTGQKEPEAQPQPAQMPEIRSEPPADQEQPATDPAQSGEN